MADEENSATDDGVANIQTFVRIRPSKAPSGYIGTDDIDPNRLHFMLPDNFKSDYVNNTKLHHAFHFNGIIPMTASQEDVFKKVGMVALKNALDGYNSTIFAYGQTGSGKTFTLTGGPEKYSDRGIIPRTISAIFQEFRSRSDMQYKMYISYLELYNEQGYDLLDPSHETKSMDDLPKVVMLEDEHGNFHLKNLSMHEANSEEDALNLLFMGDTNRAIAETPMNMASSRSHCIFTIGIESRASGSDRVRRSKLHLVDLAGSERVAKTNSSGSVLREAKFINSSLFYLEMVIVALYEKATKGRQHIPYRNSMMTSVLRDSLGGNCKTVMVATLNPEASHTEESLSTCRFAQRVSLIKNKATVNEDLDPQMMIQRLKGEMLNLREEISYLKGEAGEGEPLTPQELEDLKQKCRQYVDDPDPNASLVPGKLTLNKIHDIFAIFKNLVLEARSESGNDGDVSNVISNKQASPGEEVLLKQISDLQSCLLQRDNEIAILVNMVKTAKGNMNSTTTMNNSGRNGATGGSEPPSPVPSERSASRSTTSMPTSNNNNNNNSSTSNSNSNSNNSSRRELILQRHLFGVAPPPDRQILEDSALSFDYFRNNCQLNRSMEENRELLKDKIQEAKVLGERANQSRGTINYLKNSIESIRKERAMEKLSRDAKDGDVDGGEEESPEEQTYRRAIEQEKNVYKESFEKLKVLKPEIEHIKHILETCRAKMQNQFDEWFTNLHNSSVLEAFGTAGSLDSVTSSNSTLPTVMSSQDLSSFSLVRSSNASNFSSSSTVDLNGSGSEFPIVTEVRRKERAPIPSFQADSKPMMTSSSHISAKTDRKLGVDGIGRDDKRMDINNGSSSVDDDIQAFYQAKEEILRRRKA